MTGGYSEFSSLVGQFYACVEAPSKWQGALTAVMDSLEGAAIILFTPLLAAEEGGLWLFASSSGLHSVSQDEDEEVDAARIALNVQNELSSLIGEADQSKKRTIRQTPPNGRLCIKSAHNTANQLLSCMLPYGNGAFDKQILFGLLRSPLQAPFTDRDVGKAELMLTHLGKAVGLYLQANELMRRVRLDDSIWDGLPWAQGVVLSTGKLLYGNKALLNLLAERDGLALLNGCLNCLRTSDTKAVKSALRDLSMLTVDGNKPTTKVIRIHRSLDKPDHVLVIHAACAGEVSAPMYFQIKLITASASITVSRDVFRQLYRLTNAECRLLEVLVAGRSPTEAAIQVNVSANTIRSQLRSIYLKTGVHSQIDLMRLAMGLGVGVCSW